MSNVIRIISQLEMVGFIKMTGTGCRFVSLISETPVKLKVGCPHRGNVLKVSERRGLVNVNYAAGVCRNIATKFGLDVKEVEYETEEVWYQHVLTTDGQKLPLVVNKNTPDNGKYYLQFFPRKSTNKYILADTREEVAGETLEPFFYARSENPFKPAVIAIDLTNVKELRASGIIMQAEDIEAAEAALSLDN